LMVVGDDSQSIYSWRGANFKNILEFPRRYPEAALFKIETNYRSTPEILAMANAAIAANVHQYHKELKPSRKAGIKPVIVACGDAAEQAAFIGQRVLELRDEGISLKEMAVLYRSHFHALELQLELTRRNIPFVITSGMRFFEQAHVKDVAAYLKWVSNPQDEISFKRLVRMLPGIGGKTAMKLWQRVQTEMSASAPQSNSEEKKKSALAAALQASVPALPRKAGADWAQFSATIYQLEEKIATAPVGELLKLVIEAGYADYLKERYSNYRVRLEDLEQLIIFSGRYTTVDAFLTQLALVSNLEAEEGQGRNTDDEQLKLSSIHQAKGLEFDVVFIIMLCEGLFPSARSLKSSDDEEEERRLFYVAITRARNELYLSYPMIRGGYISTGGLYQQPSRFLQEIPKILREEWNLRPASAFLGD
jgi:DNA helicase-2/ATP-dependent DNA helicase PcrA